jgi:hypothetical protein
VVFLGTDLLNFDPSLTDGWQIAMTAFILICTIVWILDFVRNILFARRDWVHLVLVKKTNLGRYSPFKQLLRYLSTKQIISDMHFRSLKKRAKMKAEAERDKKTLNVYRKTQERRMVPPHFPSQASSPPVVLVPVSVESTEHAASSPATSNKLKLVPLGLAGVKAATPLVNESSADVELALAREAEKREAEMERVVEERASERFELWKEAHEEKGMSGGITHFGTTINFGTAQFGTMMNFGKMGVDADDLGFGDAYTVSLLQPATPILEEDEPLIAPDAPPPLPDEPSTLPGAEPLVAIPDDAPGLL